MKKLNLFTVILFVNCFFIFPNIVDAYDPPIGIPDPGAEVYGWGSTHPIDSAAPVTATKCPTWPSGESTNCYYIDNTHPQATDTNNAYGYPDKPRATLPSSLSAGSYVAIAHLDTIANVVAGGNESSPIWIVGTGGALIQPEATGTYLSFSNSHYVIIDNLIFDGQGTPDNASSAAWSIGTFSDHIAIRNSVVRNMPAPPYNPARFTSGGAGAWYHSLTSISANNGNISDIVVYGNNISNNSGGQDLDYENGRHAILSGGDSDGIYRVENVWILSNVLHNNSEDGIQLGQSSASADQTLCRYFYIGDNIITSNGENAIDLKATDHIVTSHNIMSGYKPTNYREGAVSGSDGSANVINDDGKGPLHSWWLFNEVSSSKVGWRNQSSGGDHYLIGNLVHDLSKGDSEEPDSSGQSAGVAYWQSAGHSNLSVIGNTFYNVHGGIYLGNVHNANIHNNIVSDIANHTLGWPININNFVSSDIGNNIYYDSDGPLRRDTNALGVSDLVDTNPRLSAPAQGNYFLQSDSVAIDNGILSDEYQIFYDTYGVDIRRDIIGNLRPQGSEWDIGAYEFIDNSIAPNSPTNLSVL